MILVDGQHVRQTMVHEMGHHVDHQIFGSGATMGSLSAHEPNSPLHEWWQAVSKTQRHNDLTQGLLDNNQAQFHSGYRYWLSPKELFARSFSQYISETSGDPKLLEEIEGIITSLEAREWSQWPTEDFEPVRKALDKIFTEAGLKI